jgi:hypothetical protein
LLQLDAFATDQIDRILENVAEQADEEYQDLLRDAQAISASRSELTEIQGYLVHHHAELQKLVNGKTEMQTASPSYNQKIRFIE